MCQINNELWGREVELEIVNRAIANPPVLQSLVYFFHGRSGVGKTTLFKHIRNDILPKDQANSFPLSLDIRCDDISTEHKTLQLLYNRLKKQRGFPSRTMNLLVLTW